MNTKQTARLLESADKDARHQWPTITAKEAQDAKDAAWTLYVTMYRIGEGDPAIYRANYMNTVRMIERAAGFGE